MVQGLFPLGFSFLSVTPSKQSSLTVASEAAPVTAFHIVPLGCSAQCKWARRCMGQSGHAPGVWGAQPVKPGRCVTLAKLPDFSVPLSYYVCK